MQTGAKIDFTAASIPRTIVHMAVPITTAQLVNLLYNLVDRMYIGHIAGIGSLALTGLGVCLPVTGVLTAFTRLAGGGAALCAIARGRGDRDGAEEILGCSFTLLLLFGAALTVLGFAFRQPLLYAFGASDATYPYARDYLTVYLFGALFVMIELGMNGFINAQGFARIGMLTTVLGCVVNLILDPIFIFVFGWGVKGAAASTVIAEGCSAIWVLRFLTGKKAELRLIPDRLHLPPALVGRILSLGASGFIMAATNTAVQAAANRLLLQWGGDLYVGIMTVVTSIRELATMPVMGLTSGAEPVLGFHYGANNPGRVRAGIRFMTGTTAAYSVLAWALILLIPGLLIRAFSSDGSLLAAGIPSIRLYYAGFFMMCFQFAGQSTFLALGRSRQAIFFSLLRKVLIVIPAMLILPHLFGLGVRGVFLSEPISDFLGGIACYTTMILTVYLPLRRQEKEQSF